jgi:hypothetical protein
MLFPSNYRVVMPFVKYLIYELCLLELHTQFPLCNNTAHFTPYHKFRPFSSRSALRFFKPETPTFWSKYFTKISLAASRFLTQWKADPVLHLHFVVNTKCMCPPPPLGVGPCLLVADYQSATAYFSRHCATSRQVAGSIPDGVSGIFH